MFMKLNKKVKYDSEFLKFYGLDGFMKVHMAFSDYMDVLNYPLHFKLI